RNLHAAKILLVDLVADADVDVQVAEVSARMGLVLDRNDPRRTEFEKALQSTDPAVRRAAMKQAMETAYDASDERYARLRDFRNIIVLTAMLITLFVGGLLLAVTSAPRAIPLCFTPSVSTAAPAEQPAAQVCPSGERQTPSPGDVLIVAGLGALGGGLAALF